MQYCSGGAGEKEKGVAVGEAMRTPVTGRDDDSRRAMFSTLSSEGGISTVWLFGRAEEEEEEEVKVSMSACVSRSVRSPEDFGLVLLQPEVPCEKNEENINKKQLKQSPGAMVVAEIGGGVEHDVAAIGVAEAVRCGSSMYVETWHHCDGMQSVSGVEELLLDKCRGKASSRQCGAVPRMAQMEMSPRPFCARGCSTWASCSSLCGSCRRVCVTRSRRPGKAQP